MARSRIIKPEFFKDPKIGQLSRDARLLYIGLWTLSDDAGNVAINPDLIAAELFPYDNGVKAEVGTWIKEVVSLERLVPYQVEGEDYGHLPKFPKHQRIDHPSKWKNPTPEGLLTEDSPTAPEVGRSEVEGELEVETELETKGNVSYADGSAYESPPPEWKGYEVIWEHCHRLAPDLLDLAYWQKIDAITEGSDIYYDKSLLKYLAWWESKSPSRRHRNRKRGFWNWIKEDLSRETWRKRAPE